MIYTVIVLIGVALVGFIALGLYFLPTITAYLREQKTLVEIFAINLIFGWTVVGWAIALWLACAPQWMPKRGG